MAERRAHVRVRPALDYDIRVELRSGVVSVVLSVIDVSVGGLGLVVDELFAGHESGQPLELSIELPGHSAFRTRAFIRYSSRTPGGKCGVQLVELTDEQQSQLSKAVAELLERGNSA